MSNKPGFFRQLKDTQNYSTKFLIVLFSPNSGVTPKELTQKYTQPTPQYTPTPQIGPPKPPQPIYDRNDSPSFGF